MTTLEDKLRWTKEQKLSHAMMLIDEYYHTFEGEVYLLFSGGKDSCFLKFLVDRFTDMCGYPRVKTVFNNTTNEYKEILDFVKSFGDEVIWLRPKMTFVESLKKNGYPLISKEQAQYISEAQNTKSEKLRSLRMNGRIKTAKSGAKYKQGVISDKYKHLVDSEIKVTHKCCDILKKEPARRFERETGLHPITGTTVDESKLRKQVYNKTGTCNVYDGNRPISRPLSIFYKQEVWHFINVFNIPYCSIYDDKVIDGVFVPGEERTGCAYCAFGVQYEHPTNNKFTRISIREPKRYKTFMDKLGYRHALKQVGIVLPDDTDRQTDLFYDI